MATAIPPPSKKQRREQTAAVLAAATSATQINKPAAPAIVVQFTSAGDGRPLGAPIRLPADTDTAGLELLANQLRKAQRKLDILEKRRLQPEEDLDNEEDDLDETVPYTFRVAIPSKSQEENKPPESALVTKDLFEVITKHDKTLSVEDVLQVVCEPEAVFKVRQVTRCSSSLSGESRSFDTQAKLIRNFACRTCPTYSMRSFFSYWSFTCDRIRRQHNQIMES